MKVATTQTDVQQLIQGVSPINPNNGNPNTAYNNSPGIPVMDAFGNLNSPQVAPAANLGPLNFSLGPVLPETPADFTFQPGGNPFDFNFPEFPNLGEPYPPYSTPGPEQRPTRVGSGGGGRPSNPRSGRGEAFNPGFAANGIGRSLGGDVGMGGARRGSTGGGYTSGLGASGIAGFSPELAESLGLNPDGSIGFGQLVDVLSEPFIPGDFYNSQTGTFNWDTAAGAALSGMTGGLSNLLANRYLTQAEIQNNLAGFQNRLNNEMSNTSADLQEQNINDTLKEIQRRNPTSGFFDRSAPVNIRQGNFRGGFSGHGTRGTGYGATVISGDAARQAFGQAKNSRRDTPMPNMVQAYLRR